MDCERFEGTVVSFIYRELDELTDAAARRHLSQCQRCSDFTSELRAGRELANVDSEGAPSGFTARVLAATESRHHRKSARRRIGQTISLLAHYAMRPQAAMATLLVLVILSGMMFLRARPDDSSAVHVTERGVRELDRQPPVVAPLEKSEGAREPSPAELTADTAHSAKKPSTSPPSSKELTPAEAAPTLSRALQIFGEKRFADARRMLEAVAAANPSEAVQAKLYAARATEQLEGCVKAQTQYDEMALRFAGTTAANAAVWHAANCRRASGNIAGAQLGYQQLLEVSEYRQRAATALVAIEGLLEQRGAAAQATTPQPKPPAEPDHAGATEREAAEAPSAPTDEPVPAATP